jgi:hypothetical protein
MRWFASAALLFPLASAAHIVSYDFVTPAGAGNRADGGAIAVLTWQDGPDTLGSASFSLYANRAGMGPFDVPKTDAGIVRISADIRVDDPVNVYSWNATGVTPGCYQPFANMHDPAEGESYRIGIGNVTVFVPGQNIPPSIWIDTSQFELPDSAGRMTVKYKVDEPDDASKVTLRWMNISTRQMGVIATDLPVPQGGGTGQRVFDVRCLEPGKGYYVLAEVVSEDGRSCEAFWPSYFVMSNDYDGGPIACEPADAGSDAGAGGGGGGAPPPGGCHCGEIPGGELAALAGLLIARRRAKKVIPEAG